MSLGKRRSDRRPQRRRGSKASEAPRSAHTRSADEEYRVGPGNPPREYQFKPGQSGNPKGAKRKAKSLAPDLKALFERALNEDVKDGERAEIISKFEAGFKQLATQFAQGDHRARRDVFAYGPRLGVDLAAKRSNASYVDVSSENELRQALLNRGIPARLLPPLDDAGLEPPPDPPLPPDGDDEPSNEA